MALTDISHVIQIDASLEQVWRSLADPALVGQWLGCMQYSGEIGSVFYMQPDPEKRAEGSVEGATHCELLELSEHRMRFSWYFPGTPKTFVSISLTKKSDEQTEVVLAHEGWNQFDEVQIKPIWEALKSGWASGVLPNLKRVSESNA